VRRVLAALACGLVFIGVASSPAQAQTRHVDDRRDSQLPAKYDIRRVDLTSTTERLVVRVSVRRMSSRNVMLLVTFKDGRGAPHYVRIYRNDVNGEGHDVFVEQVKGQPLVTYSCEGLDQRWLKGKRQIVLSLPHDVEDCGGAAFDRFRIATAPWSGDVERDKVRSDSPLLPG
jgi:hypothetical protein